VILVIYETQIRREPQKWPELTRIENSLTGLDVSVPDFAFPCREWVIPFRGKPFPDRGKVLPTGETLSRAGLDVPDSGNRVSVPGNGVPDSGNQRPVPGKSSSRLNIGLRFRAGRRILPPVFEHKLGWGADGSL